MSARLKTLWSWVPQWACLGICSQFGIIKYRTTHDVNVCNKVNVLNVITDINVMLSKNINVMISYSRCGLTALSREGDFSV